MNTKIVSESLNGQVVYSIKYTNELGETSYSTMTFPTRESGEAYLARASEPETIDSAQVGNMRFSLIRVDGVLHIDINSNERLTCGSPEMAIRFFNGLVGEEAEREQVTVGGPGESVELDSIPF